MSKDDKRYQITIVFNEVAIQQIKKLNRPHIAVEAPISPRFCERKKEQFYTIVSIEALNPLNRNGSTLFFNLLCSKVVLRNLINSRELTAIFYRLLVARRRTRSNYYSLLTYLNHEKYIVCFGKVR